MKIFRFILVAVLYGISLSANAIDFDYTYEGQTLTYSTYNSQVDVLTCQTKDGYGNYNAGNKISGKLILPSKIVHPSLLLEFTLSRIGKYSFSNCQELSSVSIPNSVTEIGKSAFSGCLGLSSVSIPNSVTEIGESAFSGCSRLTSVSIPNSVTEIGNEAFRGCSKLTSVSIPNSVTEIGDWTFYECSGLTSINYIATAPIKSYTSTFSDETYSKAILFVPTGCKQNFLEVSPWNKFLILEKEFEFSGIEETNNNNIENIDYSAPYKVYNMNGQIVDSNIKTLSSGIYIVRQGEHSQKISIP